MHWIVNCLRYVLPYLLDFTRSSLRSVKKYRLLLPYDRICYKQFRTDSETNPFNIKSKRNIFWINSRTCSNCLDAIQKWYTNISSSFLTHFNCFWTCYLLIDSEILNWLMNQFSIGFVESWPGGRIKKTGGLGLSHCTMNYK